MRISTYPAFLFLACGLQVAAAQTPTSTPNCCQSAPGWTDPTLGDAAGVAVDMSRHRVYVVDRGTGALNAYDYNSNLVNTFGVNGVVAGAGAFYVATGSCPDDGVYILQRSPTGKVVKYDPNGNTVWSSAATLGGGANRYLAVDSAGLLYAADDTGKIYILDNTGTLRNTLSGYAFNTPTGLYKLGLTLYVSDSLNNRIVGLPQTGTYTYGALSVVVPSVTTPIGIAQDLNGNFYVASNNSMGFYVYDAGWNLISSCTNGAYQAPYGIALDETGAIYVALQLNAKTVIKQSPCLAQPALTPCAPTPTSTPVPSTSCYDAPGSAALTYCYSLQWGGAGSGNGEFNAPSGVGMNRITGTLYVSDYSNDNVQVFDLNGNFLFKWGTTGSADGQFNLINDSIVDDNGKLYVADRGNSRIQVFDAGGNFLSKFGGPGAGNGQFDNPGGIWVDADGNIYVADENNRRVEKFNSSGNFLLAWGSQGSGNGQFAWPTGVATDPTGQYVYVTDTYNFRVQKFDSGGNYLSQWGSSGTGNGQFSSPRAIAADCAGNLFVSDFSNPRVQVFDRNGNYLTQFGTSAQLTAPEALIVDRLGNVYVGDWNGDRVVKYGFCGSLSPIGNPPAQDQCFIFPSPAKGDHASLSYYMAAVGRMDLKIFNENGELAADITDRKAAGVQVTPFSLSQMAPGVYYYVVTLTYDSGQVDRLKTHKFAVTR